MLSTLHSILEYAVCCVTPIVLAYLTILSLPLLSTALGIRAIDQDFIAATNHRATEHPRQHVVFVMARLVFAFSLLCFAWIYVIPGVVFYWELVALLTFSMVATILIRHHMNKSGHLLQAHYKHWLIASLAFLAASIIFLIALLPYDFNSWKRVDGIFIDGSMYNLMSYTNHQEQHSGLVLFKCDLQSIVCRRITRSHPDRCVASVDGRLMYDSSTNELSAEVFSCAKYVGFTHRIGDPSSSSEN
jgi:hypothetical protein